MQLLDHLTATGEGVSAFADRIAEPRNTIRKIAYRQRQPSLKLAVKISSATDGVVTLGELIIADRVAA